MRYLIFVALICSSIVSSGQENLPTQQETEEWILSKLNSYSKPHRIFAVREREDQWNYKTYDQEEEINGIGHFSFESGFLVFREEYRFKRMYQQLGGYDVVELTLHLDAVKSYIYKLPIWSFKEISEINYNYGSSFIKSTCKCVELYEGKKQQKNEDCFSIYVIQNAEENLLLRLQRALVYLKQFYPNPHVGEKF